MNNFNLWFTAQFSFVRTCLNDYDEPPLRWKPAIRFALSGFFVYTLVYAWLSSKQKANRLFM